jgi:hypothetical protein
MRRLVLLPIVILVLLACEAPSRGEPPLYAPYGAWRGRIRYVEGPHRVRTHIRWGGGLTPTGGQVLMHVATVAGNVATNENFLNAVTGGDGRGATLDPEIASLNTSIEQGNRELREELNPLLKQLGLKEIPEPSYAGGGPGNQIVDEIPKKPITELRQKHTEKYIATQTLRGRIRSQIDVAITAGDQLTNPDEKHKKLLEALKSAAVAFQDATIPSPLPAVDDTVTAFDKAIADINANLAALQRNAEQLITDGNALIGRDPSQATRIQPRIVEAQGWKTEAETWRSKLAVN